MPARRWTQEQRQAQSERIKSWRPWEKSTGPRSAEGKAVSARNAWKGGHRPTMRGVARALSEQRDAMVRRLKLSPNPSVSAKAPP